MSDTLGKDVETPLTPGERAELQRLRAEVRSLRAGRGRRWHIAWRSVAAGVLIVLGCLLAPLSVLTVWVHDQVADTDRFVATMSPVIQEPSVQAAITDRVTNAVFTAVDVRGVANDAVQALAARGVPPNVTDRLQGLTGPLENAVHGFVHGRVADIVASPAIATVWNRALTVTSTQLNQVLSGNSNAVVVSNGKVNLDLGPFITETKQQLVASGFTLAGRVPDLHPTIPITDATTLERAQGFYSLLNTVASWLPWVTLALLAAGVYVARRHRRALIGASAGVMLGMLVLAVALAISRGVLVGQVPPRAAPAAGDTFDIVMRFLRAALRSVFAVFLVIGLGAFLTGPSVTAVTIRRGVTKGIEWLRVGGARAGLRTGPVGPWVHRYRNPLRIGLVAVAVLVFLLLSHPSGLTILIIALVLLLCLGIVQFLDQPRTADEPSRADG
jgi:hypothetical protein